MKKGFKEGDIIEWNGHRCKVLENHGEYGTVEGPGGVTKDFQWKFLGKESILIASKEIEVAGCIDHGTYCPFFNDGGGFEYQLSCGMDNGREIENIPLLETWKNIKVTRDWCPLKSGPITVRLK